MICPDVCTQLIYIRIILVGLVFGPISLICFFMRKKNPSRILTVLFWVSLGIFILYSVNISYTNCGSGCSSDGLYFEGLELLPKRWLPFGF